VDFGSTNRGPRNPGGETVEWEGGNDERKPDISRRTRAMGGEKARKNAGKGPRVISKPGVELIQRVA